ncbi:MAG: EAL domain-containing protein, partial [Pseudomonadales bacterium]|nr:EAL domain-containing protein [Pseudomonadales bacterium]
NAGRATQAQLIENEQHLSELLNNKTWDLCFAHLRSTDLTPFQVITQIKKMEQDIPVILITETDDSHSFITALESGIRDSVSENQKDRLRLVAIRELDNLYNRRARRKAEVSLRDAEKRCHLLLDSSRDAIAYVHDGMHIYANKTYIRLFGYPDFDELEGMPLVNMVAPADQEKIKTFLKNYTDGTNQDETFECRGVRGDDSQFDTNMTFSSAKYDGELCTQIIIRTGNQTTQKNETHDQDIITGLQNDASFKRHVDLAIEQAAENGIKSAVLYIQLDDFLATKNSIGGASTNLVLGDVAKKLQELIIPPNLVARVDDVSFAALLFGQEPDAGLALGEKICEVVRSNHSNISGKNINLTASVGISILNENTSDPEDIIQKARDAAAFVQTQKGMGNGVQLHSPEEQNAAHNEQVSKLLEKALSKQLFRLVFQPVVSLRGDSGEHYEIMLRMPDENGNEISPNEFLQTAADKGITKDIDYWVIEQSIQKLGDHLAKGHKTHLFINITKETMLDISVLPKIGQMLNNARLPGDSVIFQISETDATAHLKEAKDFIKGANELRCKSALTHFGRALNPFNTLKHLPVSYVKIDGSFINELPKDDDTKEDLKTLVSSLHTQGKLTIAPMVDSASLLPTLWQAGINYIQGYYIQQPSQSMDYDFSTEDDDDS